MSFAHRSDEKEKQAFLNTLAKTGRNQVRAANLQGINRVTVWNRI